MAGAFDRRGTASGILGARTTTQWSRMVLRGVAAEVKPAIHMRRR